MFGVQEVGAVIRLASIVLSGLAAGVVSMAGRDAYAAKPAGPVDTTTRASRQVFEACHRAVKRECFRHEEMSINGRLTQTMRGTCMVPVPLGATKEGYGVFASYDALWTDADSFRRHGPPLFSGRTTLVDPILTEFRDLTFGKAMAFKPIRDGVIDLRVGSTFSKTIHLSTCVVKSAATAILDAYGSPEEKAVLGTAGTGGAVAQAPSSPSAPGGGTPANPATPRPVPGAVDAPTIPGTSTSGPTRVSRNNNTTVLAVAAPSQSRTLTLPPELASLKPADAFIDFFGDGGINIFVGRTRKETLEVERKFVGGGRNEGDEKSSCSQMLGKTTVAWFAVLHVAHQLPPVGTKVEHHYTVAVVCGAASMDEAIAGAYEVVKDNAGGRPFKTFLLQAAVTAEIDWAQMKTEGRLHNAIRPAALAPWSFACRVPINLDEAQGTFMPRDPGSGQAFVQYVKSLPETREFRYQAPTLDRGGTYMARSWLGCGMYHSPLPNQGAPVFTPR